MTEADYIATTNLTKLRLVYRILIDLLACEQISEDALKEVLIPVAGWIEGVEEEVDKAVGRGTGPEDNGDFYG